MCNAVRYLKHIGIVERAIAYITHIQYMVFEIRDVVEQDEGNIYIFPIT
jgi:hypothetical protein